MPLIRSRRAFTWVIALAALAVVSSTAIAASLSSSSSGPFGANHATGDPGPTWSHTKYTLSFAETGLPTGTQWSVQVVGASVEWGWSSSNTTNPTISFNVTNGTYWFSVSNATTPSGATYVPTLPSGRATVNGSNVSVAVEFSQLTLYPVSFTETGLPAGFNWSVDLFSSSTGDLFNGSGNSTLSFSVPNGTYSFVIGNGTSNSTGLFVPSPMVGNITVNGSGVRVDVSFSAVQLYDLVFEETGLPNGTAWLVSIFNDSTGWLTNSSSNSSIGFSVPNGTFSFQVSTGFGELRTGALSPSCGNGSENGTAFVASPASGNVTVAGGDMFVNITFSLPKFYTLQFTETGLPNGTSWSVVLGTFFHQESLVTSGGASVAPDWGGFGSVNSSTNTSIGFVVPNGTYVFFIANVTVGSSLYTPTPATGNATVAGGDRTVTVSFQPMPLYKLTFVESGLTNATRWFAEISNSSTGGQFNSSNATSISFEVPNGTYNFTVGVEQLCVVLDSPVPLFCPGPANFSTSGFPPIPTPSSGVVTVNGSSVVVSIVFTPSALFNVTFQESGLPAGSNWSVVLGSFYVGPYSGEASPPVSACGFFGCWGSSSNTTIQFSIVNGTYDFSIQNLIVNGTQYVASPSFGNLTVNGSSVAVAVTFAKISLYLVTFNEAGLPNGTYWSVVLGSVPVLEPVSGNGSSGAAPLCDGSTFFNSSTNISVSFLVPNGTYGFAVELAYGNNSSFVPTPMIGNVTVNGYGATVSIVFSPGLVDPLPVGQPSTAQGLRPGPNAAPIAGPMGGLELAGGLLGLLAALGGVALVLRRAQR